jgi:hypothetical protein
MFCNERHGLPDGRAKTFGVTRLDFAKVRLILLNIFSITSNGEKISGRKCLRLP